MKLFKEIFKKSLSPSVNDNENEVCAIDGCVLVQQIHIKHQSGMVRTFYT